jgi:hypothetical protein
MNPEFEKSKIEPLEQQGFTDNEIRSELEKQGLAKKLLEQVEAKLGHNTNLGLEPLELVQFADLIYDLVNIMTVQSFWALSNKDYPLILVADHIHFFEPFDSLRDNPRTTEGALLYIKIDYAHLIADYYEDTIDTNSINSNAFEIQNINIENLILSLKLSLIDQVFTDHNGSILNYNELLKHPLLSQTNYQAIYRDTIEVDLASTPDETYSVISNKIYQQLLEIYSSKFASHGDVLFNIKTAPNLTKDYSSDYSSLYDEALKENLLPIPITRKNLAIRAVLQYSEDKENLEINEVLEKLSEKIIKKQEQLDEIQSSNNQVFIDHFQSSLDKTKFAFGVICEYRGFLENYFQN